MQNIPSPFPDSRRFVVLQDSEFLEASVSTECSLHLIIITIVIWFSYPPVHPGARPSCPFPKLSPPIKLPALDLGAHQIALHFASQANSGLPLGLSPFILFSLNPSGASIFILMFEVFRLFKMRPLLWAQLSSKVWRLLSPCGHLVAFTWTHWVTSFPFPPPLHSPQLTMPAHTAIYLSS